MQIVLEEEFVDEAVEELFEAIVGTLHLNADNGIDMRPLRFCRVVSALVVEIPTLKGVAEAVTG
ncbi:hypothetical protein Sa4125_42980 [Aureimonas sp. SA4125]|nr:hypothetical protein Sa4125_42980 [Aureimonas sp. SA4125]